MTPLADSPFVVAMRSALANRLAATTLVEQHEAEQFIAGILNAHRRGEDVSQFIPRDQPEPFDAKMRAAGPDQDAPESLFATPFEEVE